MSTEQNKAVVRRFMTELLAGGNLDLIDELCAPNYVNKAMGGTDRAGFKAMLTGMGAVISGMRFNVVNLVAEGDAVVANRRADAETVHRAEGEGDLPAGRIGRVHPLLLGQQLLRADMVS